MKNLLVVLGVIAIVIGLLWIGQGTGYVPWPRQSFMISQIRWAYYGVGLAIIGLVMIIYSRQRR